MSYTTTRLVTVDAFCFVSFGWTHTIRKHLHLYVVQLVDGFQTMVFLQDGSGKWFTAKHKLGDVSYPELGGRHAANLEP